MSAGERGLKRLEELMKEQERIGKKLEFALEKGVAENELGLLRGRLKRIGALIGDAAKEEARREAANLEKEARRVRDGKKRPGGNHPGNECDEPDEKEGPANGNGGDGGDGDGDGGGDKKCCCCCCCKPAPAPASGSSVPDATCVYVRTETTVAAWNRAGQRWEVFDAMSEIVKVTFITGGILAIGKDKAAIFDCKLGQWLKPYDPAADLVDGEGK